MKLMYCTTYLFAKKKYSISDFLDSQYTLKKKQELYFNSCSINILGHPKKGLPHYDLQHILQHILQYILQHIQDVDGFYAPCVLLQNVISVLYPRCAFTE